MTDEKLTGEQGEQGGRGEQGEVGAAGKQGVKGETGATGGVGGQGGQGGRGGQGEQGRRGFHGEGGQTGAAGPSGRAGTVGDTGPAGPEGQQGIQGEVGLAGLTGADLLRQIRWSLRILVATTVLLFLLTGALGVYTYQASDRATDALCSLRVDLQKRIDLSQQFLIDNPKGAPGIPKSVVLTSIKNQQASVRALKDLHCGGP